MLEVAGAEAMSPQLKRASTTSFSQAPRVSGQVRRAYAEWVEPAKAGQERQERVLAGQPERLPRRELAPVPQA